MIVFFVCIVNKQTMRKLKTSNNIFFTKNIPKLPQILEWGNSC